MKSDIFSVRERGEPLSETYTAHEFEELVGSEADPTFVATSLEPKSRARLFVLFAFFSASLLFTVANLTLRQGTTLRQRAEGNRLRRVALVAPRGLVLDRKGRELMGNALAFRLELNREKVIPEFRQRWHEILSDSSDLVNLLDSQSESSRRLIPPALGLRLKLLANDFPEILKIASEPARTYALGEFGTHTLGYLAFPTAQNPETVRVNPNERIGRMGVEKYYDQRLRGQAGEELIEVDVAGQLREIRSRVDAKNGLALELNLDRELSSTLGRALKNALQRSGASGAAGVVLDVRNCAVRALVSLPSVDPELLSYGGERREIAKALNDPHEPFFNRAISGTYPPGSTIKPFYAYESLARGLISEETTVFSTGGLRVGNWFFPDWRIGGHGVVNVSRAIAQSVNTFFYLIGGGAPPGSRVSIKGLEIEGLSRVFRIFDLDQKTNIDLDGEKAGFFPTRQWKEQTKNEVWYIGDTYHAAIGQGDVLVTPLGLARAYATLANGSFSCQPYLAVEAQAHWQKKSLDLESVRVVRQALRETVKSGSARGLSFLPITSAGKTGTAQVGRGRPHAWYAGFAPFQNPEIAFAIVLEHGGEGGIYAVPVAKELLLTYHKLSTFDSKALNR